MYRGEPPVDFFEPDWVDKKSRGNACKPNVSDDLGMALAHLIGQIGASSHGKLTWMSIDDLLAFKEASLKSTAKGVNANPVIAGYIYGKGEKGIGYYNLNCRETYDILIKRIDKMISKEKNSKLGLCCYAFFCLFCCIPCVLKKPNAKIAELQDAKEYARNMKDATGPEAELELSDALKERLSKYKKNDSRSGRYYYDNAEYYSYAAACGAAGGYYDGGGDGCDGGGCGAAACGGGGCGG